MPRAYDSLTLDDAKQMLAAAEERAASLGVAYNIAVVDSGGHLLAFVRQDGALIGSIDLQSTRLLRRECSTNRLPSGPSWLSRASRCSVSTQAIPEE